MLVTEISTRHLPAAERFDYWCAVTTDTLTPSLMRSDHASDFLAELRLLTLGEVRVSALTYPSLETWRTARMIRQSDPENYQLMMTLSGTHRLIQADRATTGVAGELLLYDTSRPWHGWAVADSEVVRGVVVQFPRRLLPLPQDRIRSLTNVRLPCREGVAGLLAGFLGQMTADAASYTTADAARLSSITIDLLATVCAHLLEAERRLPPETRRNALSLRVHVFIERHIADPELTPTTVATAHHISVRTLNRLFQDEGTTAADWIRARRLERCRRDLADPHQRHRSIRAIAAHWGYGHPGNFTRAFSTAYGLTPDDYRRQHHESG